MANITAALVKELRERTNAGMMDCKKALVESDGDMDKAIDWLREKGLAQAAKKAGRIAAEGAVVAYMTPCGCTGALVEVNCETDFVANTDNFKNFANAVAKHVALANPADLDELMKQKFVDDESKTIEDMVLTRPLPSARRSPSAVSLAMRPKALCLPTSTWAARSALWSKLRPMKSARIPTS